MGAFQKLGSFRVILEKNTIKIIVKINIIVECEVKYSSELKTDKLLRASPGLLF